MRRRRRMTAAAAQEAGARMAQVVRVASYVPPDAVDVDAGCVSCGRPWDRERPGDPALEAVRGELGAVRDMLRRECAAAVQASAGLGEAALGRMAEMLGSRLEGLFSRLVDVELAVAEHRRVLRPSRDDERDPLDLYRDPPVGPGSWSSEVLREAWRKYPNVRIRNVLMKAGLMPSEVLDLSSDEMDRLGLTREVRGAVSAWIEGR